MEQQEWIIALLAAVSVAEFIALMAAWRRLRGYEGAGFFKPGDDCLRVTYYFLDPQQEVEDQATNLQNAETFADYYPIEAMEDLVSAQQSVLERRRRRTQSPPPMGRVLVAIDIDLVHDCASVRK